MARRWMCWRQCSVSSGRPRRPDRPVPDWAGAWVEPETGLRRRSNGLGGGRIRLRCGHSAERLDLRADGSAEDAGTVLRMTVDGLRMEQPAENQTALLERRGGAPRADIAGRYRCGKSTPC